MPGFEVLNLFLGFFLANNCKLLSGDIFFTVWVCNAVVL